MINGLYIDESGDAQIIGKIATARNIIQRIQELLPSLIEQEKAQILSLYNDEDLHAELDKRSKQMEEQMIKRIIEP